MLAGMRCSLELVWCGVEPHMTNFQIPLCNMEEQTVASEAESILTVFSVVGFSFYTGIYSQFYVLIWTVSTSYHELHILFKYTFSHPKKSHR